MPDNRKINHIYHYVFKYCFYGGLHMYYTHRPYPSAAALLKSSLFPTILIIPYENFWLVLVIWRSAAFLATTPVLGIQNFVFASQYAERMVHQDLKKLPS